MKPPINWEEFDAVQLQVGRVLQVEPFPQANKPAYIITADFGPDTGILKTSAQITERYQPKDLLGKQIVGVTNFPRKQIGPLMYEFLMLGAVDKQQGTAVIEVNESVSPGTSIT